MSITHQDNSYSMVMVTFDRLESLRKAIDHIRLQTIYPELLVIVDNGSADGSALFLPSLLLPFPFKVISAGENNGHGAGLALGLRFILENSSSQWVLLVEDDSYPQPGLAETLMKTALNFSLNVLCLDGFRFGLGKRYRPEFRADQPVPVDFALLDGNLIKTEVIRQVGVPREDFFMMCDDLEYSIRIKKRGFRMSGIKSELHHIMHMGGQHGFTRAMLWRGYYQARNAMHIVKSNFSLYGLLDYMLLEVKRMAGCLPASDRFYRIYLRMLGVAHGLVGKTEKTLNPIDF